MENIFSNIKIHKIQDTKFYSINDLSKKFKITKIKDLINKSVSNSNVLRISISKNKNNRNIYSEYINANGIMELFYDGAFKIKTNEEKFYFLSSLMSLLVESSNTLINSYTSNDINKNIEKQKETTNKKIEDYFPKEKKEDPYKSIFQRQYPRFNDEPFLVEPNKFGYKKPEIPKDYYTVYELLEINNINIQKFKANKHLSLLKNDLIEISKSKKYEILNSMSKDNTFIVDYFHKDIFEEAYSNWLKKNKITESLKLN